MASLPIHFQLSLPLLLTLSATAVAAGPELPVPTTIEFNRDVRPILSENCYACHGPDKNKRKADLRLDTKEGLLGIDGEPGVVVAGTLDQSELFRRVTSTDPDERMPPSSGNKSLSPRDIAVLKRWIEQGAKWQGHWAFIKPTKPIPPLADATGEGAPLNEIDRFIRAKLKTSGLTPAPEADAATLIRRLSLDLIGLPPTAEEVEAFRQSTIRNPQSAIEALVDKLLASPHFGERMALHWLDLVRFADTIGYHSDNPRDITPYRDYVIDAFNSNLPFDRFTIEQLAGDLLPGATTEQRVASGYNRLLQTTEEGGAQPKEYTAKYAADRVRNVSSVWLGATMGCAECHDHKFDPFTTRDFYSLAAFFADIKEAAVGRREPGILVPNAEQAAELKRLEGLVADTKKRLATPTPELETARHAWESELRAITPRDWLPLEVTSAKSQRSATLKFDSKTQTVTASGSNPVNDSYTIEVRTKLRGITAVRLEALADKSLPKEGPGRSTTGAFVVSGIELLAPGEKADKPKKLTLSAATASSGSTDVEALLGKKTKGKGWTNGKLAGRDQVAILELQDNLGDADETKLTIVLTLSGGDSQTLGKFRLSATAAARPVAVNAREELPQAVAEALAIEESQRKPAQQQAIVAHFASFTPLLIPLQAELAKYEKALNDLTAAVPRSLVSVTDAPRMVRMLPRGNWLDDSGEVVTAAVPGALGKLDLGDRRATRLDLARWLASPENPLTARVFVNRIWKLYFGQGISRSVEDLGSQGEWPVHPELLDWLAVDFQANGWDVKRLVRLIVTSATYRQQSRPSREAKQADPFNRLLSSQARFRLDAELVRDNALAISGLLSPRIGGESDKPYQPEGYWEFLNFPRRTYEADHGERQYRRGLYTHWQRSFLHPSLLAFDATSREECVAERPRSNTPQQALTLLNDPTYVEAARAFAARIVADGGPSADERLRWAFRRAVAREPKAEELSILTSLMKKHRAEFEKNAAAAGALLKVGETPAPTSADEVELAAWTSVARVILNLQETITRY